MLTPSPHPGRWPAQEGGFALILAILALLLLTFLGLTLAATTTTELQIAANQRWAQQARYNAEAGLEAARVILRDIALADGSWAQVLHLPQPAGWTKLSPPATPPAPPPVPGPGADAWGVPARDFENSACALENGLVGFGTVLPNAGRTILYQNVTNLLGANLNGAVTIWVRRPVRSDDGAASGLFFHDQSPRRSIVTAEGIAPYTGDVNQAVTLRRRQQAVRLMEVSLSMSAPDQTCELGEMAQQGMGQNASQFSPCTSVDQFMGQPQGGGGQ